MPTAKRFGFVSRTWARFLTASGYVITASKPSDIMGASTFDVNDAINAVEFYHFIILSLLRFITSMNMDNVMTHLERGFKRHSREKRVTSW